MATRAGALLLTLALVGCRESGDTNPIPTTEVSTQAPEDALSEEDRLLKRRFDREAEAEITPENARETLDAIEEEIDADTRETTEERRPTRAGEQPRDR